MNPEPPSEIPGAASSDELGPVAARAAGERLRELAEAEHARVEAEEERERAAELERAAEPEREPHPLVALGITPCTDDDLASLGEAGADLRPCPFCDGYGAVNPDHLIEALPEVIGRLAPFPASTVFVRCSECDGWGSVLTGGRTGDNGIQPCPVCHSHGYLDTRTPAGGPTGLVADAETSARALADLDRDPFTLAPPQGVPPAAGMEWDAEVGRWGYPARVA